MAYCRKCGTQMDDTDKFCPNCGAAQEENTTSNGTAANSGTTGSGSFEQRFNDFNDTKDTTDEYEMADINNNKVFAILSYIGFLFIIPLIAAKDSKFAKFHANQGLVLFIFEVALGIIIAVLEALTFLNPVGWVFKIAQWIVRLFLLILMILGIVNAANGKAKELPVIGQIQIIK